MISLFFFSTPILGAAAVGQSGGHPEIWQDILLQHKPEDDKPD